MSLLPSGLAGSGSQEEGASLTWTGGHTTGEGEREKQFTTVCSGYVPILSHNALEGERERNFTIYRTLVYHGQRESDHERPKEAQLLALKGAKA